jgi:putative lipoic acid-binding regulatory protein
MTEESTSLFKFPCQFPIKAMGKADIELDLLVMDLIQPHITAPEKTVLKTRASKNGQYLAVTVMIEASSQAQLDAIYRQLSAHPSILMAF